MKPMKPLEPMKPMKPMAFKEMPRWWPQELGSPDSAGSQNDVEYAYFRSARRLVLRSGGEISTYDTGDHDIQGVSQASGTREARFTSDRGSVDVAQLKRLQ